MRLSCSLMTSNIKNNNFYRRWIYLRKKATGIVSLSRKQPGKHEAANFFPLFNIITCKPLAKTMMQIHRYCSHVNIFKETRQFSLKIELPFKYIYTVKWKKKSHVLMPTLRRFSISERLAHNQPGRQHIVLFKSWEALVVVIGQIQETLQTPRK